jgi:hypothetical protein
MLDSWWLVRNNCRKIMILAIATYLQDSGKEKGNHAAVGEVYYI